MTSLRYRRQFFTTAAVLCAAVHGVIGAQQPAPAADAGLDSLLNACVNAASKYEQRVVDAPASVTILTADEIRPFGYRNLQDALESVRGFYVSNDRNYPYLGAGGFSRPTDYNNRILVLVGGHTLNEQVWGSAPVGGDLPINLDAVERIEIVRGPGSVLYGTNAVFGVINIVTKTVATLDGVQVSARGGSGRSREAGMAAAGTLAPHLTFSGSALVSRTDGGRLYYPEYDDPSTNFGIVNGLDWERANGALGHVQGREVGVRGGFRSRAKGIPTGAYGTVFGDPRTQTVDDNKWAELYASHLYAGTVRLSTRLYTDQYRYHGAYPVDTGSSPGDRGASTAVGGEAIVVWDPTSRDRLTV